MANNAAVSDPLGGLSQLFAALGGTKTTQSSNPGDVSALQQVLAQSQGINYEAMLQSIFQQAAGQIPGLQNAMAGAIGARSTGNSAMQAALSKLLQQTTIAAQQQIAEQQQRNLQTQTQAAQGIAQATKGTSTTQKSGTNLGQAAKMLAGLQMLSKARGLMEGDNMLTKLLGGGGTGATSAPVIGSSAVGTDLPAMGDMGGMEMSSDIFAPAQLPADFDQPIDLSGLFGGDTGGVDLGGFDWSQLDTSNADLGGWVDPMTDGTFDAYLQ